MTTLRKEAQDTVATPSTSTNAPTWLETAVTGDCDAGWCREDAVGNPTKALPALLEFAID